jgi:hypothetical protein
MGRAFLGLTPQAEIGRRCAATRTYHSAEAGSFGYEFTDN